MAWPSLTLLAVALVLFAAGAGGGAIGAVPLPAALALVMIAEYLAFTVMHEAAHGLIGRRRRVLNQIVGELSATLFAAQFTGFRQVHGKHHRYACDPERDPHGFSGRGRWWQLPFRLLAIDVFFKRHYDPNAPLPRREAHISNVSLVVVWSAIGLALYSGFWAELLFLWLVPAKLVQAVNFIAFDYLPHQRPYGVPESVDARETTVAVSGGRLLEALMLGHASHLVHHFFPTVPWYRLDRSYRLTRAEWLASGFREVPLFRWPRPAAAVGPAVPLPDGVRRGDALTDSPHAG